MSLDLEDDEQTVAAYGITAEDAPRYTMWKSSGAPVATIVETGTDGSRSWRVNIHDDAIGDVVESFLERHGAPVFETVQGRNAHVAELERQLRAGLTPRAARDAALQILCLPGEAGDG